MQCCRGYQTLAGFVAKGPEARWLAVWKVPGSCCRNTQRKAKCRDAKQKREEKKHSCTTPKIDFFLFLQDNFDMPE